MMMMMMMMMMMVVVFVVMDDGRKSENVLGRWVRVSVQLSLETLSFSTKEVNALENYLRNLRRERARDEPERGRERGTRTKIL